MCAQREREMEGNSRDLAGVTHLTASCHYAGMQVLTSRNLANKGRACLAISMAALALMKLWMNIVYMFIRWHLEN